MTTKLKPMSDFDPTQPAMVHDLLNDKTFQWNPDRHLESYRRHAVPDGPHMVAWEGLLLDGWTELDKSKADAAPSVALATAETNRDRLS
jgi:hypothetical protein